MVISTSKQFKQAFSTKENSTNVELSTYDTRPSQKKFDAVNGLANLLTSDDLGRSKRVPAKIQDELNFKLF